MSRCSTDSKLAGVDSGPSLWVWNERPLFFFAFSGQLTRRCLGGAALNHHASPRIDCADQRRALAKPTSRDLLCQRSAAQDPPR